MADFHQKIGQLFDQKVGQRIPIYLRQGKRPDLGKKLLCNFYAKSCNQLSKFRKKFRGKFPLGNFPIPTFETQAPKDFPWVFRTPTAG